MNSSLKKPWNRTENKNWRQKLYGTLTNQWRFFVWEQNPFGILENSGKKNYFPPCLKYMLQQENMCPQSLFLFFTFESFAGNTGGFVISIPFSAIYWIHYVVTCLVVCLIVQSHCQNLFRFICKHFQRLLMQSCFRCFTNSLLGISPPNLGV